jgi:crotonobetainyl-CoA:carnitine CoA-transferase CaiB-like acyl-CoA transferase
MLLGDLGARIIKVERPVFGDDTRAWGPPWGEDGQATYFASVNRNKESIALDLRNTDDLAKARELAVSSDVLIENFKTGTMQRMGLGYDDLKELKPRLVYCTISGFGDGAGADLPGYDLLVQAMGGLMSITGPAPGHPTKVGVALVDVVTGLHASVAILAALRHAERTGEGQYVHVTLLGSLLSSLVNQAQSVIGADVIPGILGNHHPSISPYAVYETGDRPIVLAVGNDGQFRALCKVIGRDELASDERFATNPARVQHRDALTTELESALAAKGADEWQALLTEAVVPAGPINNLAQAIELADSLGLDPVVTTTTDDGVAVPGIANPARYSATPATYRTAPPTLPK